jgi:tRNA A-37 threonylcarbamoyl transferase component Bud32
LGETSLYHYIKKKKKYSSLKEHLIDALRITYRISKSIAEMHANGIVHRDLKSGNVVILNEKAWVIDLGMSKR